MGDLRWFDYRSCLGLYRLCGVTAVLNDDCPPLMITFASFPGLSVCLLIYFEFCRLTCFEIIHHSECLLSCKSRPINSTFLFLSFLSFFFSADVCLAKKR